MCQPTVARHPNHRGDGPAPPGVYEVDVVIGSESPEGELAKAEGTSEDQQGNWILFFHIDQVCGGRTNQKARFNVVQSDVNTLFSVLPVAGT
jgi:hypothetical protein